MPDKNGGLYMDAIRAENLKRDYGDGKGVFDVSFSVPQGEAFGFLGPNGAGKTTVIRHLMGFIRPKGGKCAVCGMDCWEKRELVQGKVGYIPGEISFFDDMTGAEFLKFIGKYRKIGSLSKQKELIDRFELDTKSKIKKMSKGTKQKVGIVSAFMADPEVLILDEPTGGLDPLMQGRFIDLINEEKSAGKTIFLSSHMFEEVERTCDRIGIIRRGHLVAVDSVHELRKRHIRTYSVQLDSQEEASSFARDFGGSADGCTVKVSSKPSLEEIFMNYYEGEYLD